MIRREGGYHTMFPKNGSAPRLFNLGSHALIESGILPYETPGTKEEKLRLIPEPMT